jgi:putative transposase
MSDELRERLIVRILRMSPNLLPDADRLLTNLECGDSSPLSGNKPSLSERTSRRAKRPENSGDQVHIAPAPHGKDWPRAPLHRLSDQGTYIVTAGTLHKEHWFRGPDRLDLLESALLRVMKHGGWQLEAWAVFSNHYHFVASAESGAKSLSVVLKQLHGETSREVNPLDRSPGRMVWHNFWDTELTYEKSYLARLIYVHQNAVKHGLVALACQYRWCSAAWFERTAPPAQVKTIYGFKIDRLRVEDEFEPV